MKRFFRISLVSCLWMSLTVSAAWGEASSVAPDRAATPRTVTVQKADKKAEATAKKEERKKQPAEQTDKTKAKKTPAKPAGNTAAHRDEKMTQPTAKRSANDKTKRAPAPPSTAGIRKLQNEQADLQRQMRDNARKLDHTRRSVSSGLASLQELNGKISDQERVVKGIRHELDTLTRSIGRHETELQSLEADLAECRKRYARGILFMYRNRLTRNKLMFVFSARNFSEMFRRLRYTKEYTRYQRAEGLSIVQREAVVRGKREQLSTEKSSKDALLARGKQQQSQLEDNRREQQRVVDDLNRQQRELQSTIAAQQARSTALNREIDRLIQAEIRKEEQRRREEEARRKRAEEAHRKAEEARKRAAEEKRRALEAARKAEAEARRKAEETRRKAEEAKRKAEEAKRKADEARRKAEEARRRGEAKAARERAEAKAREAKAAQAREEARAREEVRRAKQAAEQKKTAESKSRRVESTKVDASPEVTVSEARAPRGGGNFAALQGRLPAPVNAAYTVSSHFGSYNVAGLRGVRLDNKGVNLTCSSPASARAVADGDVTAVFSVGGMSNVIVRHGAYISVYCNLSGVSVRAGQHVRARQSLGSVARDASGRYTLHFQLRRETQKLNPERWLAR